MYSGGWAFSNSRKSVKYPPHDPHTSGSTKAPCFKAVLFGILQKPNKSKSSQKRTKPGLHAGSGQSRQLPAVHFCQCSGLALSVPSIVYRAVFRLRTISPFISRFKPHLSLPIQKHIPAHTRPYKAIKIANTSHIKRPMF